MTSSPFASNDAINVQAYNPLNRCLAIASQSGEIKMFSVESCSEHSPAIFTLILTPSLVKLTPLWTASMKGTIPRGLLFYGGTNQSLITLSLETAEMYIPSLTCQPTPLAFNPGAARTLKAVKSYGRRPFREEYEQLYAFPLPLINSIRFQRGCCFLGR